MKNYGLRFTSKEPQEYKLSHVLYSFKHRNNSLLPVASCEIGLECKELNYSCGVAARYYSPIKVFNRIKLALKVLLGKADILYYE
jgi:hypothetical protein